MAESQRGLAGAVPVLRMLLTAAVLAAALLFWWYDRSRLQQQLEQSEILHLALRTRLQDRGGDYRFSTVSPSLVDGIPFVFGEWEGDVKDRPVDTDTLTMAALVSGRVIEDERIPEVAECLQQPGDPRHLAAACRLAACGAEARGAVGPLIGALDDADPKVRWYVIIALGRIGPEARDALPRLRTAMAGDSMPALAAKAIRRIDPGADVVDRLLELLTHRRPATQRTAMRELTRLAEQLQPRQRRAAVEALAGLLADDEEQTRRDAITAVARLAPRDRAITLIGRAFQNEPDRDVRGHAAATLNELDLQP